MSPVTVGQIGSYLREQREQAKISVQQLAQAAGVPNPYLSQIERGLRRPSADLLQQIAKGLRISAEALQVPAGLREDEPPGPSAVRTAVQSDGELTERQKQMLIEVYDSFRKETAMAAAAAGPAASALEPGEAPQAADDDEFSWPEDHVPAALAGGPDGAAITAPRARAVPVTATKRGSFSDPSAATKRGSSADPSADR